MFHKVLVGTDGHAGGLDAAALARELLAPGGKLVLAHVYPGYPVTATGESEEYLGVVRADVQALLAQASAQTGIRSVVAHGSASVGQGLRELAETESADLVVIGSTSRGLAARVFIGDHTREWLNAARGAVAVAPAGYAQRPRAFGRVGVASDASQESRAAAAAARELAVALHAKLSAIEVGDQLAEATGTVDLLVIGSRSLGPVGRLLHGSTSQHLARKAQCPLLILPVGRSPEASGAPQDH